MGEVAETMMKKKKKKGRPSLLELQKRALKQQQQEQRKRDEQAEDRSGFKNPNSGRRSTRRGSSTDGVFADSASIDEDGDVDDDDDERREKKHKLLHGLNSHTHQHSPNSQLPGSDLNLDESSENPESSAKRSKITGGFRGSDVTEEKGSKATVIPQGSLMESGPTTPLPDKMLLVFILDRLQKKDTYGVFSDPVDPEELPDYHEIIANPMDFSTVRKKLDSGIYSNLEQFERDVFLICTNAMEYNAPDTIYYRQARGMHEMARKDFENLRQESEDEEEEEAQPKVTKRNRPPVKNPKKQSEPSSIDRTASEVSADAITTTPIALGGNCSILSGSYNLRKPANVNKFRPVDPPVRGGYHNHENPSGWSVDWENEFPTSVVKAVNKYGMKHFNVDENRRDSYNQLSASAEHSIFTTLEDELKQLIPVGLNTEYGYARSLARHAAHLGPVAWNIASRRIKTALAPEIKFGPGWVGENPALEDHSNRISPLSASVSATFAKNADDEATPLTSSSQTQQSGNVIDPAEPNVFIRGFSGLNHGPDLSQHGSLQYNRREIQRLPPDLNAQLAFPRSPSGSNAQSSSSSQHPDLALQL